MTFPREGSMKGKGRPGGDGGNKVAGNLGGDAIRKSRPGGHQSSTVKGSDRDALRKARPLSGGSGQSTNTK